MPPIKTDYSHAWKPLKVIVNTDLLRKMADHYSYKLSSIEQFNIHRVTFQKIIAGTAETKTITMKSKMAIRGWLIWLGEPRRKVDSLFLDIIANRKVRNQSGLSKASQKKVKKSV